MRLFTPVAEIRLDAAALGTCVEEVDRSVHEGVLVADDVPGRPPLADVVVAALSDEDVAETAAISRVALGVKLEPVHVLHVPGDGTLAAVDLEGVAVATPRRVARRLDRGEGAVREFAGHERGAFDLDLAGLGRILGEGTLFRELFPPAVDLGEIADEEMGEVDRVGTEVPERTGRGGGFLQLPVEGMLRIHEPALLVGPAPVEDLAEFALVDHSFGEEHGGAAAVIVVQIVHDTRLLRGGEHGLAFGEGVGERFLTKDMFAGLGCGNRHLGMEVGWGGDVNRVDVAALQHFPPIGRDFPPAPAVGEGAQPCLVAAAGDLHDGFGGGVEKLRDLVPGIRVGAAHEAVADDGDTEFLHTPQAIARPAG